METTIKNILRAAGLDPRPTQAEINVSDLPVVTYTVTGTEPQLSLDGMTTLAKYSVDVDVYAVTMADCLAMLKQVRQALHYHTDERVKGSFLTQQYTAREEYGAHGTGAYSVWADMASTEEAPLVTTLTTSGGASMAGTATVSEA